MSEVVLIYPPIYFDKQNIPRVIDVSFPPLGPLYLCAGLKQKGIAAEFLDVGAAGYTLEQVLTYIEKENPRVVGLSSMTANLQGAVQIAKAIRDKFADEIAIGLGGAHASADPEFGLRFPALFDFTVTGEAEITFPEIVRKILDREPIEKIYHSTPPANLDVIPFPYRQYSPVMRYKRPYTIISSRGCPYECIFCSRPAISRKVRYRNPRLVVDEMESNYHACNGEYLFEDDTFTLKKNHADGICQEILDRNLKVIWSAITRADLVNCDILQKMYRAGCREITLGIESGSQRIRNEIIRKNLTNDQISNTVSLCKQIGIKVNAFLMMGFPTETKQDLAETIEFVHDFKFNVIGIHITIPWPGSPISQIAQVEGKIPEDLVDRYARMELGEGFRDAWPFYVPDGLTLTELHEARKNAYFKFYLNPRYIASRFLEDITSWERLKYDIVTFFSLIFRGRSSVSP